MTVRCELCWTEFESPLALLEHEVIEEGQTWPLGYAPSTAADTQ